MSSIFHEDSCIVQIFNCGWAVLWRVQSVCTSVHLTHLFPYFPIIVSSWNVQELLPLTEVVSMQKVKIRGQKSRSSRSKPNLADSRPWLQFELSYSDKMMHKAWCGIEEVPYCFSRSSVKFQCHKRQKKWLIFIQIEHFWSITSVLKVDYLIISIICDTDSVNKLILQMYTLHKYK